MGIVQTGEQTMVFVIFGVAIGALCAVLRYPALMMLPLGGLLIGGAALNGIIVHAHPMVIATEVFGSIAASQFAYASVSLTRHLVRSREAVRQAQAAIGQELRAQLKVPRGMPSELSALVAQLQLA
jgi:hypothetical protein